MQFFLLDFSHRRLVIFYFNKLSVRSLYKVLYCLLLTWYCHCFCFFNFKSISSEFVKWDLTVVYNLSCQNVRSVSLGSHWVSFIYKPSLKPTLLFIVIESFFWQLIFVFLFFFLPLSESPDPKSKFNHCIVSKCVVNAIVLWQVVCKTMCHV